MDARAANQSSGPWDVAIIGAGPAGSTCAALLARAGHKVLLLEREHQPGSCTNCTGILGQEAFDVFDLPRELIVNTVEEIKFLGPYRREVEFSARKPLAHVVRRSAFDSALASRAAEAGAEVRLGVKIIGGVRTPDDIEIQGIDGGHPDHDVDMLVSFCARSVVLAVGYNVTLLRAFGMEAPPEFVQGVQLLCRNRGVEQVEVYVGSRYAPGSFGWAVPLDDGWVKVGLTTSRQSRSYLDALVESPGLQKRIDLSYSRIRTSPIPVGSLRRCHDDRVLVIGEAAGQVKTTSNGGIYYSMLGAKAAADVLDASLRNDTLSAPALEDYERAWRALLEDELLIGRRLRSSIESMSDAKLAALMWLGSVGGMMDLIRERADFDWHRPLIDHLTHHRLVRPILGPIADSEVGER
jgi:geranylgeranyl reductase family protein